MSSMSSKYSKVKIIHSSQIESCPGHVLVSPTQLLSTCIQARHSEWVGDVAAAQGGTIVFHDSTANGRFWR